jgi:hypothetical protein
MGIFLQLFYYFGHIILFSIELVNMYIFKIFKIHYIPSVISLATLLCLVLNLET